jgi:hypothetical protein
MLGAISLALYCQALGAIAETTDTALIDLHHAKADYILCAVAEWSMSALSDLNAAPQALQIFGA